AFSCFTVMPALLKLVDRRPQVANVEDRLDSWRRLALFNPQASPPKLRAAPERNWLPLLARRPWAVIGVSVLLTVALGAGACRVYYDHNLLHLQAHDLESVKWELKLIERTAGASWHALSYTASQAEALALKARYEQLPEVSRVVEVAS